MTLGSFSTVEPCPPLAMLLRRTRWGLCDLVGSGRGVEFTALGVSGETGINCRFQPSMAVSSPRIARNKTTGWVPTVSRLSCRFGKQKGVMQSSFLWQCSRAAWAKLQPPSTPMQE
jgi:hypothetical protein